jgi:hypothetical protein
MVMRGIVPIIVGLAGVAIAAGAGALLWSANYAAAVWLVSRQSAIWLRFFNGEIWLPAMQAWTWRSLPIMSKLLGIATGGLAVEAALIGGGGYFLIATPWKVRKPSDGSRIATLTDLKKAGLLDGAPGYFDAAGHVQRAGCSLQRRQPFLCQRPLAQRQGQGLRHAQPAGMEGIGRRPRRQAGELELLPARRESRWGRKSICSRRAPCPRMPGTRSISCGRGRRAPPI